MISVVKKLGILMNRKQKNRIKIIFLITLIGTFLEVLGVSLMLPLVTAIMQPDIIENNEIIKKICELLDLHSHRTFVIACIIALILLFIIKNLFLIIQYYVQARFIYNNQLSTQKELLHSFINRPYEYFLNSDLGEILRVIQNDVSAAYNVLTTLISMSTEIIVSLALAITVFIIDPLMTVFVIIVLAVVLAIIIQIIKPILKRKGYERQSGSALNYKWIVQAITGIKEVKVTQKETFFEDNYAESGKKSINAEKWNTVFNNIPRLLIEMATMCSVFSFIAFIIYKGRDIATLIPVLAAFAMAAVKLMPSANRIIAAVNTIAFYEPALDKLIKNIKWITEYNENNKEEHFDSQPARTKQFMFKSGIELKNICYKYPNSDKKILENANMSIPIGKSVGIVGKSGAGKTTVVDIILGLLHISSGELLADGVDVMDNYSEWLSHIGYIPQSIFMMDASIRENVAFGYKEAEIDDDRVIKALEQAQLKEYVECLDNSIYSQIGERGIRLSGGQRQRIGIARALYSSPEILIFDEATAALDNETEASIMESITRLKGEKTIIIIAHRLHTIEGCDMVYRVEDRKIVRER